MSKKLTIKVKYTIADAMAPSFQSLRLVDKRSAFGVVINAPVKFNGVLSSLKSKFTEDEATHITNLVLRRVYGNVVPEISL